ncbi:hemoblobin-interacting domain-containing protein [Paenibacillus sp. sgz302251]|uniref:hemoblobin-interacting domain-containing protein n=1 Tax=Paenibacillus sp. sgz302251 TaxID=3414493 RepID=UPI003C7C3B7F
MYSTSTKKVVSKKIFISLLLGLMLFTSFSYSAPASAAHALPANPLIIASPVVSEDKKTVTVTSSVYAAHSGTEEALKTAITVKKSGTDTYSALGENDMVELSSNTDTDTDTELTTSTLVVTFENALTGNDNAIRIAAGALVDSDRVPYDQVDLGIDVAPPAYTGSYTTSSGQYVYLYFDESIIINNGDQVNRNDFLRSQFSISYDGLNFQPLMQSDFYHNGNEFRIFNNDNDMQLILGANTLIKIASGTLKDEAGNLNEEMILHVSPPVIQSAEISSDYKTVTITFNEEVSSHRSNLNDAISLYRNGIGSRREGITENYEVSIESGKLVIEYEKALTGDKNQIVISGSTLKDSYGNVAGDRMTTPIINGSAGDSIAPELVDVVMSKDNQAIVVVFDEKVLSNKAQEADLRAAIRYFVDDQSQDGLRNLPEEASIEFLENTLIIQFPTSFSSPVGISIQGNSIKDTAGNVYSDEIYYWYYWSYPDQEIDFDYGYFSNNGRLLILDFDRDFADNTNVEGIKEKIEISTDQGKTYPALGEQDIVTIFEDKLIVLFHEPKKTGTVRVKIEAGTLTYYGNITNPAIDEIIAYNTPNLSGYFLSDAPSEFVFEDNEEWRNNVRDITVYEYDYNWNQIPRRLDSSEYTLTAGKLTINPGTFLKDRWYSIYINAAGYSSKYMEGNVFSSGEVFYMTAPRITTENGITATIDVVDMDFYDDGYAFAEGTQSVVFQLMDGTTPVSIVTANLKVGTGTYSANFNVADAATNPNYTVRAFIVTKFNADSTSIGVNLATQVTQSELDIIRVRAEELYNDWW